MSEVAPEITERTSAETTSSALRSRWIAHLASFRTLGIVIPFVALFITLSIASGPFLTKINLVNLLGQQSSALIIGAGSTLVLISGGIDLSVGATYGLASVVAGEVDQHNPALLALVVALGLGAVIGAVNGVVSTVFKINSLIATLAMSFIITERPRRSPAETWSISPIRGSRTSHTRCSSRYRPPCGSPSLWS